MAKGQGIPYNIGDTIRFRYYNKPEDRFYGPVHEAIILDWGYEYGRSWGNRWFRVRRLDMPVDHSVVIKEKELRGRVSLANWREENKSGGLT